jgi:hypothetical protein
MDTDFDSDSTEGYIDNSPRRSLRSVRYFLYLIGD